VDERTRNCVRRMRLGDIASLPMEAFCRAMQAFDREMDLFTVNRISCLRGIYVNCGMDSDKGQSYLRTKGV